MQMKEFRNGLLAQRREARQGKYVLSLRAWRLGARLKNPNPIFSCKGAKGAKAKYDGKVPSFRLEVDGDLREEGSE
jgi:hypothetical protein